MLAQVVEKIILEQEKIIGPIALEQAKKVQGLSVDWSKHEVKLEGNEKEILEKLVKQYELLFGRASVEVCKEAVGSITDKASLTDLPEILKD